ncbi:hypothetical protein C7256_07485 [Enterocloster lavalensis]|nr:hypothetical protein C7256_07485 [Enterocloster lavalensis]
MAPFGDGFKFRVYEISLRRRESVVKWLLMGDGRLFREYVQTAGLLDRKSRSRSIGCSSDVKIGAKRRLQASLTRLFAPIFAPSELFMGIYLDFFRKSG